MRHVDSRYGTSPAIVQGAIQKNTNDPNTAPTVLVTLLLPHHVSVFAERRGEADPLLVVTDGAPGLIAGADPRRNGDDYPMTSLSDGLGPQNDPNSGRTRVESGPAGTHRPTTRREIGRAHVSTPVTAHSHMPSAA